MRNMHYYLPLEDADGIAVDDKFTIVMGDLSFVTAMGGIIFEHVDLANSKAALSIKTAKEAPFHEKQNNQNKSSQDFNPFPYHVLQVNEGVIDGDHLDAFLKASPQNQTANTAKAMGGRVR